MWEIKYYLDYSQPRSLYLNAVLTSLPLSRNVIYTGFYTFYYNLSLNTAKLNLFQLIESNINIFLYIKKQRLKYENVIYI